MAYPYPPYSYLPYMQGYNQPAQPMQQAAPAIQQPPQPSIKVRPVASEEEARGVPVEFDGSLILLPDMAHGAIYSKQLNMQDGSAIFRRYMIDMPDSAPQTAQEPILPAAQYATLEQLQELKDELDALRAATEKQDKPTTNRGGAKA